MKIVFQAQASQLNAALETVSIVPPKSTTKGGNGYLFVVSGEQCYVYSRNDTHMARTTIDVSLVEGEGSFIYPADYVKGFKFLGDEIVTITATDDGGHSVGYTTGSRASVTHPSVDPQLITPIDKDLDNITDERVYPAAVLLEALRMSKPFAVDLAANSPSEDSRTIQVFDDSKAEYKGGNGNLLASSGYSSLFFYTEAFKDKGLSIHVNDLRGVSEFITSCGPEVKIKVGPKATFAINDKGWVYGWVHQAKDYTKFAYHGKAADRYQMVVPVAVVQNALRYLTCEMDKNTRKIRVEYAAADKALTFKAVDGGNKVTSFPVSVLPKEGCLEEDIAFNVNIDHFRELFLGAKGREILFHLAPFDHKGKLKVLTRTLDEFVLDSSGKLLGGNGVETQAKDVFPCLVTRFVASMA